MNMILCTIYHLDGLATIVGTRKNMHYFVDGNNVTAARGNYSQSGASPRRQLIDKLVGFISIQPAKVVVFFDGEPDPMFPDGCKYRGVQIYYSKRGSDADSRIKEKVRRSSYRRDIVVVSSDRSLAATVSGLGAGVMPSHQFNRMLNESIDMKNPDSKSGCRESVDVSEWLDFFGKTKKPHG